MTGGTIMISTLTVSGSPNNPYKKTFLCDTIEDINLLPHINSQDVDSCAAGSTAVILKPSFCVYMLNNSDEWCKI